MVVNSLGEPCPCKKPNTLLCERAAREHRLEVAESFVIGDSPEDVQAARRLGARGCLVRTGWATDPHVAEMAARDASVVVAALGDAVDWISISPITRADDCGGSDKPTAAGQT